MPIQLTTPYDPGDADPGVTYPRVIIFELVAHPTISEIELSCHYGTGTSTAWVDGVADPVVVHIRGTDYTTIIQALPLSGSERLYDGVSRVHYQYLLDNGHFSGTIV